tara:strand:- start:10807 stop:12273 length:1467 start_codon:yes stop_codon:yes gene_type:complete
MKISSNWTLALKLVLVSSTLSFAGEYRDRVIVISKIFRNSDPDVQYVARRDLEVLVSDATAPVRANGASKITDDLLYALDQNDIPVEAKKYILRQLARVGTSKAVSPLAQIMMARDKRLAEEARAAIESIRGSKASDALKVAYGKMNTEGKLNILKSLALRGESSSVRFIANELDNSSESISVTAAWALGEIGNSSSLRVLRNAYSNARPGPVNQAIERSLLSNPSVDSNLLYDIFSQGKDSASQRAALRILIKRQDRDVEDAIRRGIKSEEADLRTIAIESALSSGVERFQRAVLDQLGEMGPEDMLTVLGGLNNIEGGVAESIALKVIEIGNVSLRLNALDLIGEVGSKRSIDLLLNTFENGDRASQIKAASAIAKIDTPELDKRLAGMLKSSHSKKVLLAQEILVYRNIPNAKLHLLEAVKGNEPAFARGALKTLSVIADSSDLDQLYTIANSKSGEQKRIIVSLLKKLAPDYGSKLLRQRVANL